MERITKDFSWHEMTASETAERYGIRNEPGRDERQALEELVKRLLQPLRLAYGRPIRITSGYRCEELNRLVRGVGSSQHLKGEAADCTADNVEELLNVLLVNGFPFDQAVLYRKRNFLHLSLKRTGSNRHKVIIYK